MAENIKRHITHIKSKVANQKPTSSQLLEGEIAVNYAKDKEFLSIKNESGDVVTFSSDNYYTEQKLGSGFTRENSGNTVTKVIEDNEKVISSALNALNEEISNLDNTYVTLDTNQTISGKKTFLETINIEDGMNVSGTSRLYGDVKMNKSLSVSGTTSLSGQTKMYGNLLMNNKSIMGINEIEASGSLNAGDTTVSSINVQQTANVNGNLQTHNMKPMEGDIYDIGNPGGSGPESGDPKYYRTIYVRNVNDIPVSNLAQSKDVNYLIYNLTDVSGTAGGTNLSASWSGNCDGITELTDGMNIQIKIPVAGHNSGVTISINGGEKHKCILNASTNLTTHYPQGAIIRLVYDANQSGTFYTGSTTAETTQGVWKISDYDANTNTIGYALGYNQVTFKVDAPTHRYVILFTKDETTLTPVNSVSSTAGTKTLTTEEFDPFGGIYYKSSKTDVTAGSNLATGTVWTQSALDLRYSFNTTTTLIAYQAVYMVVVPQSNGKVKLHTDPISQTLPTTEDGLVYIYLGQAYNTTNLYLAAEHPLYQFKNGKLMSYTADDRINGYLPLSGGTMTNTNKVVNLNADLLDGYNVDYEGNANTVAIRTSYGSLKATYFNQSSGAETPTDNSYWVYANNDGNFRKSTRQNLENVLKPYEAKVQWGGGNFADGFGCIDAAMVDEFGANRTQFLDGEAVDVEYSRDSGVTWQDYGASTLHKKMFFSVGNYFYIGKNNPIVGSDLEKYQLRITINTGSYLYTRLRKFVIGIATRGSSGCWCTIDGRIQSAVTAGVDEWTTFASGVTINGNSGNNVINTPEFTTHGNNPIFAHIHYGQVRFTFGCTGKYAEDQSGLGVYNIKCFGNGWSYPSNMARNGHLYTYDQDQNATFPNSVKTSSSVYANGFHKTNSNDNYFLLGGGGHVARSGYTSTVELTNYMTTSSTLPTDDNTIYTYNGKVVEKRLGHNAGGDDIIAFATHRDVDGLQMDSISVLMYSKWSSESSYKYGGSFNLSVNTGDTTVQELRSIFGLHNATTTTDGLMSASDKKKLNNALEYIHVTYDELKTLKQQDKLQDGAKYRIEDFVTTTTQANTQSANHPFDIIVTATGRNTLNETAMAAKRNNDTYFSGSNLSAWDIKYCFENDADRFGWADPTNGKGVIYYMKDEFSNEAPYDFKNIQFKRWKATSVSATTSGVPTSLVTSMEGIFVGHYHLYSNTPYTINSITITPNTSDSKFFYTFSLCGNGEEDDSKTVIDGSLKAYGSDMYKNNVIREYMPTDNSTYYMLNNIVFKPIDDSCDDCACNVFGKNCRDMTFGFTWTLYNSFGNNCNSNSFGNHCNYNSFGNGCCDNFLGYDCGNNSFGNGCSNNSLGNDCDTNSFGNGCNYNSFGETCGSNSFGNNCYNNSFGENYYSNSFENDCGYNSFGDDCYNNFLGNDCDTNSFGNSCSNNSFGNSCSSNSFGNSCSNNSFGNNCKSNSFGNGCIYNSFGNSCNNNFFENGCESNSFGNECSGNTSQDSLRYSSFGNKCYNNTIENEAYEISFGNTCSYNNIDENCDNIALGDLCHHIIFNSSSDGMSKVNVESGNMYITLYASYGSNITIAKGVNNSSTRKTINHTNINGKTTYQNPNSTVIDI